MRNEPERLSEILPPVRVTPEIKDALQREAIRRGTTTSDLMREFILAALDPDKIDKSRLKLYYVPVDKLSTIRNAAIGLLVVVGYVTTLGILQ